MQPGLTEPGMCVYLPKRAGCGLDCRFELAIHQDRGLEEEERPGCVDGRILVLTGASAVSTLPN
jgi:hypothetical protein